MVDQNIKTAIYLIVAIAVGVGVIGVALTFLDEAAQTTNTVSDSSAKTGNSTEPARASPPANPAPKIVGIAHYLNTTPEELDEKIEGSVVLYDIWTYSCINCIRTLPYITSWNEKYEDEGLLIIGIHSPEFEFEKDRANVELAMQKYGIEYPVVMDNDMETWRAFENRYWPRKYIADHEGSIRYDHIGEGDYENTERVIQTLLAERAEALGTNIAPMGDVVDIAEYDHANFTPELYFGYILARGNQIGSPEGFDPGNQVTYTTPDQIENDRFYLDGTWSNLADGMMLISNEGTIKLSFHAKQVNIVAGSTQPSDLEVYIDSQPISAEFAGSDVADGIATIGVHELYNIFQSQDSERHTLELRSSSPGFEIFTFTFG